MTLPLEARVRAVRLHQLEGFYYTATHGGFTRAADAMPYPITEPALHQQVRKLERSLGVSLLVRGPKRRMLLTPDGRRLLAFVAPYFEGLPAVLREVAQGDAGELVVGAEPLYVEGVVAPGLAAVRARRAAARLRVVELDLLGLVAALRRGDVDCGVAGVVAPPPDLVFERLGSLGLSLLVPPGHALLRRRGPLEVTHLEGLDVVAYERDSEGRRFGDAILARAGLHLTVAAEASTASAMRALVRTGIGPAIVPALVAPRPGRRAGPDGVVAVDLTPLAKKVADLPPWGALRRIGAPSALVASFVDAARVTAARG